MRARVSTSRGTGNRIWPLVRRRCPGVTRRRAGPARRARQTVSAEETATVTAGESEVTQTDPASRTSWLPLVALAIAQFVMVLDQSAMNVSISTLVDDFDTTVPTIQGVITLYCLVMAMFMLTGGKIG